ncbi:MAG: glycosyltransferase family 2 protein [Candidatus Omnitrophota bacterium]
MVSVIIPVKNGARTIAKCLDSVLALDYSDYEVIVVDDGSTDETTAILTAYNKRVQVITNKQSYGPSESRNLAAKLAKGEYLAFTDSDCLVDKDWLKELVGGMKADDIVSVGGAQMTPDDDSDFGKKVSRFMQKDRLCH